MKKILLFSVLHALTAINVFADNTQDLIAACMKGDLEAVKTSVSNGADVNALDSEGNVALAYAFFGEDITKYLLENGADPNKGATPAISNAIKYHSVEVMKTLISKGADVSKIFDYKKDMTSIYQGMIDAEKAKGKQANKAMISVYEKMIKDSKPITIYSSAISSAITSGCKDCLNELVNLNADFKAVYPNGDTYLDIYTSSSRSIAVKLTEVAALATYFEGAGYKVPDWYKSINESKILTPQAMLSILTNAGLDVKTPSKSANYTGKSQLMISMGYCGISASDPEAIIALIKAGSNVNEIDDKWGSIINLSIRKGNLDIVQAVVEGGADVNVESKEYDEKAGQYVKGFTPLTLAAMTDRTDLVTYLLPKSQPSEGVFGFSFNIKTNCATTVKNKTAIFFAIENGNMEMVKALVENSSFNWAGKKFTTNQMKQSSTNYGYYVTTTITKCFNDGEYTPSKYAKEAEQKEIMTYLKEKGL